MLPWMCGRQTLTIVVSSPCMMQAQMIVAVIAPRLIEPRGGVLVSLTGAGASRVADLSGAPRRAQQTRTVKPGW